MGRNTAWLLGVWLALGSCAAAQAGPGTDARIVTGLDISDSVSGESRRAQIAGLAAAMRAPIVLRAIARGRHGRIAIAFFVWHQESYAVVPWSIVGSAQEAEAVAHAIETRMPVDPDHVALASRPALVGRLTDLSRAIDEAANLAAAAPVSGGRLVVNIIGNGPDNIGEPAGPARDRLVAAGATVNGVVLDGSPDARGYYRDQVIGGPGAFLIAGPGSAGLEDLMLRKFLFDLVAAADAPAASLRR